MRAEIEIDLARAEVAAYAAEPDNATSWYLNIKSSNGRRLARSLPARGSLHLGRHDRRRHEDVIRNGGHAAGSHGCWRHSGLERSTVPRASASRGHSDPRAGMCARSARSTFRRDVAFSLRGLRSRRPLRRDCAPTWRHAHRLRLRDFGHVSRRPARDRVPAGDEIARGARTNRRDRHGAAGARSASHTHPRTERRCCDVSASDPVRDAAQVARCRTPGVS